MWLWILVALHLAATAAGFAFFWRRHSALHAEVERLREALGAAEAVAAPVRRRAGATEAASAELISITPSVTPEARAARAWRLPETPIGFDAANFPPDTTRGLVLGAIAAAPALGFFFGIAAPFLIVAGLGAAAAMMLLSLRPEWRAAAWASVITAAAWGVLGLVLGAAQSSPVIYSVFIAFAGIAGLTHAHLRRATPGLVMGLATAALSLALASQTSVIGAGGVAFGIIVAAAAIIGAMSLRLEAMHLAAFGAALVGLFVLSGQDAAAIWFTPATAWAGALFLAIAIVRVPQLGARGVALAGTGVLVSMLGAGALHWAQHGLANPYAASGAFTALAAIFSAIIGLSAARRAGALASLKITLWVLALGGFAAITTAIFLALPAPFAACGFAAVALGLTALNTRLPDAAWRTFACVAAMLAAGCALASAQMVLSESQAWDAWVLIGAGLVAPAILVGGAALFAARADAKFTASVAESVTFGAAVIAVSLLIRLYFSGGALLLQPVGFVELGAHAAAWLIAALLIASRSRLGAGRVRVGAAILLGMLALVVCAFGAGLWLTPYWSARPATGAPLNHAPLGFLLPAIMFWANWVFWRARGAEVRTRVALAAGAMLLACYVTLEMVRIPDMPDWASALVGAVAFALAIAINFASGITAGRSDREEDFHRNRRREQGI